MISKQLITIIIFKIETLSTVRIRHYVFFKSKDIPVS